jgi:hypothetical protein
LINDHATDSKTEAYSSRDKPVLSFLYLDVSEQFEEALLIHVSNADPIVFYRYLDGFFVLIIAEI